MLVGNTYLYLNFFVENGVGETRTPVNWFPQLIKHTKCPYFRHLEPAVIATTLQPQMDLRGIAPRSPRCKRGILLLDYKPNAIRGIRTHRPQGHWISILG